MSIILSIVLWAHTPYVYIQTRRKWNIFFLVVFNFSLSLLWEHEPLSNISSIYQWLGKDASKEWLSSSFLRLRSRKAGLIGVVTISILNVNNATISDMGGLKCAWGWRHKRATWVVCITSFSTNPSSLSFGSTRSNKLDFSYSFHAYIIMNIHFKN